LLQLDAHIIGGDARLEHLVAMKSLIAGIVIMMLRYICTKNYDLSSLLPSPLVL